MKRQTERNHQQDVTMESEDKMRNYELVKRVWNILHINSLSEATFGGMSDETKLIAIENLIKKERPELNETN